MVGAPKSRPQQPPTTSLQNKERTWHDPYLLAEEANRSPWSLSTNIWSANSRFSSTQSRTVLIMKDPNNYLAITNLSTTLKLFSGIVATKMSRHMSNTWAQLRRALQVTPKGQSTSSWLTDSKAVSGRPTWALPRVTTRKPTTQCPCTWLLECLALKKRKTLLYYFIWLLLKESKDYLFVFSFKIH